MNKQTISLQDFVDAFQVIVGQSIWRVIHPADGWLTIDFGRKYMDTIPGKDGKNEPYDKGQYQIHITGDWKVYKDSGLVESRGVNGDDQKSYFGRMEKLATNFPLTEITSVNFDDSELAIISNNFTIRIPVSTDSDYISLTSVGLDNDDKPFSYTHYRFDEKLGQLARISTK